MALTQIRNTGGLASQCSHQAYTTIIFSVLSPRKVLWPIYPERSYGPHLSYRNAAGIYSCIGFLVMKVSAAMNVLTPLQKKLLLLWHPTLQRS